jgi:hypothetical protein
MEFVRVAENDEVEAFEATEQVKLAGKAVDEALKSFKGRKVLATGIEGSRLWVRVAKDAKKTKEADDGA